MKKLLITFALTTAIVVSCTTERTFVTGTWMSPQADMNKNYNNILVAALTDNIQAKKTVENDIATRLREDGITVKESINVFPPNFTDDNNDKEYMLNKIKNNHADGILTIALIDKDTKTRYVPGNYLYSPYPAYPYYGYFWGYYSYWYPQLYEPGYYTEDKIYYIETNLYDVDSEKLVWSAQSKTYDPVDLTSFSRDFANKIVSNLEQSHVLDVHQKNTSQGISLNK